MLTNIPSPLPTSTHFRSLLHLPKMLSSSLVLRDVNDVKHVINLIARNFRRLNDNAYDKTRATSDASLFDAVDIDRVIV